MKNNIRDSYPFPFILFPIEPKDKCRAENITLNYEYIYIYIYSSKAISSKIVVLFIP